MKKLLFILFLASPCFAAGPKHSFEDPIMNDELTNVYFDQANTFKKNIPSASFTAIKVSTITAVSSATITNLTVGTLTTSGALGKFIQMLSTTTTSSNSTTATSFINTPLQRKFTPTSLSSHILIRAHGTIDAATTLQKECGVTIVRDGSVLGAASGMVEVGNSGSAIVAEVPFALNWDDTPGSTASLQYNVAIKTDNAADTCTFNPSGLSASMTIEEVTP